MMRYSSRADSSLNFRMRHCRSDALAFDIKISPDHRKIKQSDNRTKQSDNRTRGKPDNMTEQLHHIRLLAGLEIESGQNIRRTLERAQAEQLAAHLAEDLHRHVPEVDQTLLVCAGAIFEPFELMRPGFPVW